MDPNFADILGGSAIADSAFDKALQESAERIRNLVEEKNEEYSRTHGVDIFKATNKTVKALADLGKRIRNYNEYRNYIDKLYFIFRESVGSRLEGKWPGSFVDINTLRTAEQHDVDHGKKAKIRATRKRLGSTFKRYSGATTPSTLDPEKFAIVQAKLLTEIENDLRTLRM